MSKIKTYKFSDKNNKVKLSLQAANDDEAFKILGAIVQNVSLFANMKVYRNKN